MKRTLPAAVAALVLAGMVVAEIRRYGAEHRLGSASATFESVLGRPSQVENAREVLPRVGESAAAAAEHLPGDSRGWVLAGSCQLVAGNPDRALAFYRRALETGERAEIHLNLGRAEALLARPEAARAAFLRSIWISPTLLGAVPPGFQDAVSAEVNRLEADLRAGKLAVPPLLPR